MVVSEGTRNGENPVGSRGQTVRKESDVYGWIYNNIPFGRIRDTGVVWIKESRKENGRS